MRTKEDFAKQNEYNKGKYDRTTLMLPKGTATIWKEKAKEKGMSVNTFVQKAVEFYLENSSKN